MEAVYYTCCKPDKQTQVETKWLVNFYHTSTCMYQYLVLKMYLLYTIQYTEMHKDISLAWQTI